MPLSAPTPRTALHTRRITCEGFARDDGRWDIEGHITDTKSYDFASAEQGQIKEGMPVHDMWIRLTIDDAFVVHDVEAVLDSGPFNLCPAITPNFQALKGLKIGPGWNRRVRERLGGIRGCTHMVDLLNPMATVAYQTLTPEKNRRARARGEIPAGANPFASKFLLNSCHAWASDSPVVEKMLPELYTGDDSKADSKADSRENGRGRNR